MWFLWLHFSENFNGTAMIIYESCNLHNISTSDYFDDINWNRFYTICGYNHRCFPSLISPQIKCFTTQGSTHRFHGPWTVIRSQCGEDVRTELWFVGSWYKSYLTTKTFKGIDFRSQIIKEVKIFAALIFCVNYINLKFLQK